MISVHIIEKAIEKHFLSKIITLIQGSSIDENIFENIRSHISPKDRVMVILDPNHTHQHVLKELELYSSLVTKGCYLLVMDTIINDMPKESFKDRPWSHNDNPKTAVKEFLKSSKNLLLIKMYKINY